MNRPLVVALVLLFSCTDSKLTKVEADLQAAKFRVTALKARAQELAAKKKQAETARWSIAQQAEDAALASAELSAAADVLEGKPVPPGFLLPAMLASKEKEDVVEFASNAAQAVLPCVTEGSPDPDGYGRGWNCDPPPLADSCSGVDERRAIAGRWSCTTKVPGTGKAPPVLACTLDSTYPPDAPGNEAGDTVVTRTLVRAAFAHGGHLFVADWPAPSVDIYQPRNRYELEACHADNERAQCERSCEEKFGRLDKPDCGMNPDWGGDGEDPATDTDPDEDPAVTAARQQAEYAEERAAAAEKEAQEARDELAYQECRSTCRPTEEELAPKQSSDTYKFLSSPAPGVLAFQRTLETPADNAEEVARLQHAADEAAPGAEQGRLQALANEAAQKVDARTFITLLELPDYGKLAAGESIEAGESADHMLGLELLTELEDATFEKSPPKWLVYGLDKKKEPASFTLDSAGHLEAITPACSVITGMPQATARLRAACEGGAK